MALGSATAEKAAAALEELEHRHGWQRETVWARRGEARLAQALEHLVVTAQTAALPSHEPQAMSAAYVAEGWKADWAALRALDIAISLPVICFSWPANPSSSRKPTLSAPRMSGWLTPIAIGTVIRWRMPSG